VTNDGWEGEDKGLKSGASKTRGVGKMTCRVCQREEAHGKSSEKHS